MTIEQRLLSLAAKAARLSLGSVLNIDFCYEEVGWGKAQRMVNESVGEPLTDADFDLIAACDPATVSAPARVVEEARNVHRRCVAAHDPVVNELGIELRGLDALEKEPS